MRWGILALGVVVGMPVAFLVALSLLATDKKTDCATVRDPTPARWQAADYDARSRIATDLSLCRRLQGRSQAEVEALLGPPTETFAGGQSYRLFKDREGSQDKWVLFFGADGRVPRLASCPMKRYHVTT